LQSGLASAVKGIKSGDVHIPSAALIGIAFLYGVFHAIGPGHGRP
jgi:ABC-type nickel/cobalt efflux system permease component RcnA